MDGIFLWALEGLHRLIANDYHFTVSERAEENMRESISEGNNVILFLESEGYIAFKADYSLTSQRLYELYRQWCEDNAIHPMSNASFFVQLAEQAPKYNLEKSNKIPMGGREVRGYAKESYDMVKILFICHGTRGRMRNFR